MVYLGGLICMSKRVKGVLKSIVIDLKPCPDVAPLGVVVVGRVLHDVQHGLHHEPEPEPKISLLCLSVHKAPP
jgi:hypothetical protein